MKRYRPPKHRRKHYDPQPSKRRANIYALTHARALYFYAALRVNSNYTRIQHGTPQRFQDPTAPTLPTATGKLWHARWRKLTGGYDPVFCSTTLCRQVALWANKGPGGSTHLRMTQCITAPAQMCRKPKPKAFQDSRAPTLPLWTVHSDAAQPARGIFAHRPACVLPTQERRTSSAPTRTRL